MYIRVLAVPVNLSYLLLQLFLCLVCVGLVDIPDVSVARTSHGRCRCPSRSMCGSGEAGKTYCMVSERLKIDEYDNIACVDDDYDGADVAVNGSHVQRTSVMRFI